MKILVAFPRTGTHMCRELFQSLARETIVIKHDVDLSGHFSNVAHVERDALNVLYSHHVAEKGYNWDIDWLKKKAATYKAHCEWYRSVATIHATYEELVKEIIDRVPNKWAQLADYFNFKPEESHWNRAFTHCSKENIIRRCAMREPTWFNERMLTDDYALKREEFRQKFACLLEE